MKPREFLIYLSLKYSGDYHRVLKAIMEKEEPDADKLPDIKSETMTILDDDYPPEFKMCPQPPIVLYYYGDRSLFNEFKNNLAVIGTRKFSKYGETITEEIVNDVVPHGINIVSGLALGIDTIAHESALASNGKTIAVLGCGIDYCYPPSNKNLYEKIKQKGLIFSEYPGMTLPEKYRFPIRNRLIAAMSKVILVTEAHPKSGTSITVTYGLDLGRTIAAVPYGYKYKSFCNYLIKKGAYLVQNGDDVLELFGIFNPGREDYFEKC